VCFRDQIQRGSRGLLTCLLAFAALTLHAAEPVERIVELRGGDRLRLQLPDRLLTFRQVGSDGVPSESTARLSDLTELRLARTPAFERLASVRGAVSDLGAARFRTRASAQQRLTDIGGPFRSLLQDLHRDSREPEVRWRLAEVLLTVNTVEAADAFDALQRKKGPPLTGDVGSWTEQVTYRGAGLKLDRASVRRITTRIAETKPAPLTLAAAVTGRIAEDKDSLFPTNARRVDFSADPQGKGFQVGENIGRRFIDWGFTLDTSISGAIVSVTSYNVGGRSGGNSAATHRPLYQGVLTVRFCLPGNARIPAGVRYVGLWVSHVSPNGTALAAFDAAGRQIADIRVIRPTRDFLAVRSSVPIAYIKVVPNIQIDADYAIDDLVFDRPLPLEESGDETRFTLDLHGGERIRCRQFAVENEQLVLQNVAFTESLIRLRQDELTVLHTPLRGWKSAPATDGFWMLTRDGSMIRGGSAQGLTLARDRAVRVDVSWLSAIWGGHHVYRKPEKSLTFKKGDIVTLGQNVGPVRIKDGKFGATGIESDTWKPSSPHTYLKSPVMWLSQPPERNAKSGLLRLTNGEQWVLGGDHFRLTSYDANEVIVTAGDQRLRVLLDQVISLRLPR